MNSVTAIRSVPHRAKGGHYLVHGAAKPGVVVSRLVPHCWQLILLVQQHYVLHLNMPIMRYVLVIWTKKLPLSFVCVSFGTKLQGNNYNAHPIPIHGLTL